MPEVICLLSSSPPRYSPSPPPQPPKKRQFRKPTTVIYDLSSPPISPAREGRSSVGAIRTDRRFQSEYASNKDCRPFDSTKHNTTRDIAPKVRATDGKTAQDGTFGRDDDIAELDSGSLFPPSRFAVVGGAASTKSIRSGSLRTELSQISHFTDLSGGADREIGGSSLPHARTTKQMQSDFMFLDEDLDETTHTRPELRATDNITSKRRRSGSKSDFEEKSTDTHSIDTTIPGRKLMSTSEPKTSLHHLSASGSATYANNKTTRRGVDTLPKAAAGSIRKLPRIDSDPITFTSSPDFELVDSKKNQRHISGRKDPEPTGQVRTAVKAPRKVITEVTSDCDSDDLPELPSISNTSRVFSRTTSDVTEYRHGASKYKSTAKRSVTGDLPPRKRVPKSAEEKAIEAAAKAAEKEAAAEKRKLEREERARDKLIAADLAKVNTLKTDKKKSTPEMIVLFHSDLDAKLREQSQKFLRKLDVECKEWAEAGLSVGNYVRWNRKVEAMYNEELDLWEPVTKRIEEEKHILVYMPAQEFVDLAISTGTETLDTRIARLQARFHGYKIIYLIEGLHKWQQKNKTTRNRAFVSAVRGELEKNPTGFSTGRKGKSASEYIDDDAIEDALLRLQIIHKALIHHTTALVESAEWISIFTQHISTIPYRRQRMNLDTAFCMESGQVRTGEDAKDTYAKMLCEIGRLTAPVAWGIQAEYPSVSKLVKGLEDEGKEALKDVKKSANKDGAFTDRTVGKALSKRVWSVFLGRDPGSTDV